MSGRKNKVTFEEIKAAATSGRVEDYIDVWFDSTLHTEWAALARELEDADEREQHQKSLPPDQRTKRRIAGQRNTKAIAAEMNKLLDDNPSSMYRVHVRAALAADWARAKASVPPRDNNSVDRELGVNWDKFRRTALEMCLVDPQPDAENMAFLDKVLSAGEFDRLGLAVMSLNEQSRLAPFSDRLASLTPDSDDD